MVKFKTILLVSLILIITFTAFSPCLKNRFVNWDDDLYVTENTVIQNFSFHSVNHIFTSYFTGNYQPLTMLSYLFEYKFFKLDPFGYHLTNLILHLLNCFFVFWLIYMLTRRISVSSITTFLFGLHPLHVESVAWVSERKDLFYALFFLAATVCYCYYLQEQKIKRYYYLTLILFILALLSKSMAITLPLVLFLIDYLFHRKRDKSALIDKITFFILSFIFGTIAVTGQYSVGAVRSGSLFNFFNKIVIASYSVIFYLNKILVPIKLSCLYPYSGIRNIFPFLYSFFVFIILFTVVIVSSKYTRKIIFGSGFFLITLLPVLQFIPIGQTIVADRYLYIASIGIFYILAEGIFWLFTSKIKYFRFLQCLILVTLIAMISVLVSLTWKRCQVWKDGKSLWSDVLNKYPDYAGAYNNRAIIYKEQGNIQQALSDYNKAIKINFNYEDAYYNRGNAYCQQGNFIKALFDYNEAIKINPNYAEAYNNRAIIYKEQGNIKQAFSDYNKAIEINSNYFAAYNNRGITYYQQGNFIQAISDYNRAIEINPNYAVIYCNRGLAYVQQGNLTQAFSDYTKAIKISPNDAVAYNNRGFIYYTTKEYKKAWADMHRAEELGLAIMPGLLADLKKASGKDK